MNHYYYLLGDNQVWICYFLLLQVDREEITFTSFEKELEASINIKFSSQFGTVNITDEQRSNERDLLWDQKMKEILFSEKFEQENNLFKSIYFLSLYNGDSVFAAKETISKGNHRWILFKNEFV